MANSVLLGVGAMNFDPNKPIVTLTKTAAGHVRRLMDSADNDVIGIRVGVENCWLLGYAV